MRLIILALAMAAAVSAHAATYTVNSVADPGDGTCDAAECTLREAILAANADGGSAIVFAIGSGAASITTLTELPAIEAPTTLDATTQPGYAGTPLIALTGSSSGANCLTVKASDTTVRGLDIGNCLDGIHVAATGASLSNIAIERNFIGARLATATIARKAISLNTDGPGTLSGVTIGDGTAAGRNLLATFGFVEDTLFITGNVSGVTVAGNYFGLNDGGGPLLTAARFTSDIGIYASSLSSDIVIGGSTPGARNVFGSGGGTQINIKIDSQGSNLTIEGNYIGTDPTGTVAMRATNFAVWFYGQGEGTIRNNVITAGNTAISRGVTTTGDVIVRGNWINLKADASGAFPLVPASAINDFSSAPGYVIGGPDPGDGNVIVNYHTGVSVNSPGALVEGNLLGLGPDGNTAFGSGTRGIATSYSRTEPGVLFRNNTIAGFANGIVIGAESLATVNGNRIGTDLTGMLARPNTTGIVVTGAAGRTRIAGNAISGNSSHGIFIDATMMPVDISGNTIGLSATGTPLPNGGDGVRVNAGSGAVNIGFLAAGGLANSIAHNLLSGVAVPGATHVSVLGNSIFANGGLAIDLGPVGVTPNDVGDADTGGNDLQNAPLLTAAASDASGTSIDGVLNSTPGTPFLIELYANATADPSNRGETQFFLTRFNVVTDASGNATFSATAPPLAAGTVISSTATNNVTLETSEASNNLSVVSGGTVQFAAATTTATEADAEVWITVTRSGDASVAATVDYSTADGTAIAGVDYTAASGTLSFAAGETSKTIQVVIADELLDEPDEAFAVILSNPSGTSLGSPVLTTVTIADDDPEPVMGVPDVSVSEGNSGTTTMTFTVAMSGPSERIITVDYATADGTATAGSDYGARFGTLTFAPGETSKSVAITVNGNVVTESDETIELILSAAVHANLIDTRAVGTIVNEDGSPSIAIADATAIEGNAGSAPATVTLSLSNPSSSIVSVDWTTNANTAAGGSDFTSDAGTVTFGPGEVTKTIAIAITGDVLVEGNETLFVALSNASNATLADAQAEVTLVDDDGSPSLTISDLAVSEGAGSATLTVLLAPASGQTVEVAWSVVAATAATPSDYTDDAGTLTFAPGETTRTIAVAITDDTLTEGSETFRVVLSGPVTNASIADGDATVTIIDDDPTPAVTVGDVNVIEGDLASFTVVLSNPAATTVTVDYQTQAATATAADFNADAAALTFAPGEISKSVAIQTIEETLQEPDEQFFFALTAASNATITRPQATATIADDDGVPTIVIGDGSTVESNSGTIALSFDVTLAGNSAQTVTVDYTTANGTAAAGSDYAATSGHLIFAPGTSVQTIEVPVVGDREVELDETLFVNLANVENATLTDNQATGTISNDDAATVVPAVSISDAMVAEGDGGTTPMLFEVTLSEPTTVTVTVDYATGDATAAAGADYAASAGSLVFTPGMTSRTISVAVAGDTAVEGSESLVVVLTAVSNATLLDGQGSGTIVDDDVAAVVPSISIGDAVATEGDGGTTVMTFAVTLSTATTSSVTVDYATANGSGTAGADYAASSGTLLFAPGVTTQTIAIAIAGDAAVEGDETLSVVLANAVNGTLGDAQGNGTIVDDDVAAAVPSISIADTVATEGDGGTTVMTFAVTLSTATTSSVTVDYGTANGSATAGGDYAASSGTLLFAPGVTTQTIAVAIAGDEAVEGDETLSVVLANAVNGTLADAQATGTIVDDDAASSLPSLTIDGARVIEGDEGTRNAAFRVTLSTASETAVIVDYATSDGTADAGSDYVSARSSVVFPPGTTTREIVIAILGDARNESNETFRVRLSNPSGATLADAVATGTIVDDDEEATAPSISIASVSVLEGDAGVQQAAFAVTLSHPAATTVTVDFATVDRSASAGADYGASSGTLVFAAGDTARSIAVGIAGDTAVEPDETFAVVLANADGATVAAGEAIGTIEDDDGERVRAIFVIVGSGAGNGGAFFRTELQLHNATDASAGGELLFRPIGGGEPRSIGYVLEPRETRNLGDLLGSGFGSVDVVPLSGALPEGTMRVFSDEGAAGAPGFLAPLVPAASAIREGGRGLLLAPANAISMRYNLGLRSLESGATLIFRLRRADGSVAGTASRGLAPDTLEQISAASLFGVALEDNDAIEIEVTQGAVVAYGSAVDNASKDPSFILAVPIR